MSKQIYLPPRLTLLPLPKPHVLYPFLQTTVSLPQEVVGHLLATLSETSETSKADSRERFVAAVPVADGDRRLGRWACAARVKRLYRSKDSDGEDGDVWMCVLEGLTRVYLPRSLPPVLSILPPLPIPVVPFSLPVPPPNAHDVDLMPAASKLLPSELHPKLAQLPPSVQADLLASTLRFDWEVRVDLLGTPNPDERCARVRDVMIQILHAKGITVDERKLIGPAPGASKALVPRRNAQASHAQLPDDLKPLAARLEARGPELSAAAHEAVTRELMRLAKIPSQSAEYGVSKTYCEWILALPWNKVSEGKRVDLEGARRLLDSEHEGLADVKRRVVEYLAVYRLKRDLWDEEKEKEKRIQDAAAEQNAKAAEHKAAEVKQKAAKGEAEDKAEAADEQAAAAEEQVEAVASSINDQPPDNVFRDKAPIILLVGPPGVGKTSIARSIAHALGRKFHRISLGGVRDEAEIRGHRRTYVGALPGLFVQALRKVAVANPVLLLDELDKVGTTNFHGDPSAALLETLDPAQNWTFHDHYLGDVPIDLSQVTFIATANSLDTISPPLLDRCEVIECPGYITDEKLAIAKRFLLPKQARENGLKDGGVHADDKVLERVVTDYTNEAGVRSLEREIAKLCRHKAVQYSASREGGEKYNPEVTLEDLEGILGMAKYEPDLREQSVRPGVVTGLAYRSSGNGGILIIESTLVPGNGTLMLTGSLGQVIQESAELAFSWVRAHQHRLGISPEILREHDVHLHMPAGAVKKDGPSAGVAFILAFVSLLTDRPVPPTIAFTGEITLRGAVTPVGGIREKVLGAHRAGISQVILPAQNEKDTQDLPASARKLSISYVRTIEGVLDTVWGRDVWSGGRAEREARL